MFNLKKIIILVFLVSLTLISFPTASSLKEVKTIEYPIQYMKQPSANTNYQKNITIESPDGIQRILSFEIYLKGDFLPSTDIKTRIRHPNGTLLDCTPSSWTSPNVNTSDYETIFDCSDLVREFAFKGGKVEGGFRLNRTAQNIYTKIITTYLNNPPMEVASIGGTEYSTDEPARVVLQMIDNEGNPINNGTCFTTIRDGNDTIKADNQSLSYMQTSNGLYFYQFLTTLPVGVYSTDSYCTINGIKIYSGDTFHVANWAESIGTINSNIKNIGTGVSIPYISFVGGTEYSVNETVGIRTQFLNGDGNPINPYGECRAERIFAVDVQEVVWDSADEGVTWDIVVNGYTGSTTDTAEMVSCNDGILFAVDLDEDVFKSTNGVSWTLVKDDFNGAESSNTKAVECSKYDNKIMIIESDEDVWVSSDRGITWNKTATNFNGANGQVYGLSTNTSGYWFTVDSNADVWLTSNGTTWTEIVSDYNGANSNLQVDYEITDNDTHYILEGSSRDVWKSLNGYNWAVATSDFGGSNNGVDMTYDGQDLYITNGNQDIWRSSDNATTWTLTATNFNLVDGAVISIFPSSNTNFCGARAGHCNFSVFAPNGTKIIDEQNMTFINDSNGIFSYDWDNTTKPAGIYVIDVVCVKGSTFYYGSSTFHVSSGIIELVENVSYVADALATFHELKYSGATEYKSGDSGHVSYQFLRVAQGNPQPINNGNCNVTIWYPNRTLFVNNASMTYLSGSYGLYYYNFTVPDTEGVYITDARCVRITTTAYGSSTFHVSNFIINVNQSIISNQGAINQSLSNLIINHNNTVYVYLQSLNTTMTNYYLSLNSTAYNIKTTLDELYGWFISKISIVS